MSKLAIRICGACVIMVVATATPGRGGSTPVFNVISSPGFPYDGVFVAGVSANGTRVVGSVSAQGANCAMVWREVTGMTVRCFTGSDSGHSISGDGAYIGGTTDIGFNPAYVAGALSGDATQIAGVNGVTRGLSSTGNVAVGHRVPLFSSWEIPFRWSPSTGAVDLPLLNGDSSGGARDVSAAGNVIVGYSGGTASVWRGGPAVNLGDLPGGSATSKANAVSSTNDVIVGRGTSTSGVEATRWILDGTNILGLGDLPGGSFSSEAFDVSGNGQIIVGRGTTAAGDAPFIWDSANGMRDLQMLLAVDLGLDLQGVTLRSATGISANGTVIVGNGVDAQGFTVGWHAQIPEPATGIYLLAMAATMLCRRLRSVRDS